MNYQKGKLFIVGIGPGDLSHITARAVEAIEESNVIVGYRTYINLIQDLIKKQEIVQAGMTEEVERAQEAVRIAETGKKIAVISSGDAGIYGMAGLIYEILAAKGWNETEGIEVEVIPGVSAIQSSASILGAPLMHDYCSISLSDHLTPWQVIKKRIELAAEGDFVIGIYNPKSSRRIKQLEETQKILLKYRSPNTPVGVVTNAYRQNQQETVTTLEKLLEEEISMVTTLIIGNSSSFVYKGKMITPRGYQNKYDFSKAEQTLKPNERLKSEAEPWALR